VKLGEVCLIWFGRNTQVVEYDDDGAGGGNLLGYDGMSFVLPNF